MKPLTRKELDHLECGNPNCTTKHESGDGLAFHSRCHPGAAVETWYQNGVLTLRCKRCSFLVAHIQVAAGPVAPS